MSDPLPPHDELAEASVIASAISDAGALAKVIRLRRDHFYMAAHQTILAALKQMAADRLPVDSVTLRGRLNDAGKLQDAGGDDYLQKILNELSSAANLPAWLERVEQKYEMRRVLQICTEVGQRIMANNVPVEDLKFSVQSDLAMAFGGTGGLPEIVDSAKFMSQPQVIPPELIEGILHQGSKLALGGSSKSFKTWALLDLALSVAHGLRWLGLATTPGKVLFVNFEIAANMWQRRIEAVLHTKGITLKPDAIHLWNLRGCAADFRTLIPKIIQCTMDEQYSLIVLDPLYKLYGGVDENSAGDVAELLNSIERVAVETGAAVAYGCHFAKGNAAAKEAIDRMSGSGVFARDPDSLLIFTQHEEEEAFTVQPILRNFQPVSPFVVRWNYPLFEKAEDLNPDDLKQPLGRKKEHDPKTFLESISDTSATNPISISEWSKLAGIPRKTLADYLPQMRVKGWVKTVGEGTTSKQHITLEGKNLLLGGNDSCP